MARVRRYRRRFLRVGGGGGGGRGRPGSRVCAVCASTCLAYLSHVRSHVCDTPGLCGFLAVLSALSLAFVPRVCAYVPWPLLAAAACGRVASRVCGCGDGRVMDMVVAVCPRCVAEIGPRNANQTYGVPLRTHRTQLLRSCTLLPIKIYSQLLHSSRDRANVATTDKRSSNVCSAYSYSATSAAINWRNRSRVSAGSCALVM